MIAGDRELDALELEVEQLAVALLALQQPMARDLRFIISAIKVSSDLERVGDHAVNIAAVRAAAHRAARRRSPRPEIEDMARRARAHAGRRARRLHPRRRRARPRGVRADDQVDALHDSVFRILLTHMMADAADDQSVARAAAREPEPRARRRPGDEHRRGRGVPRRREADQASIFEELRATGRHVSAVSADAGNRRGSRGAPRAVPASLIDRPQQRPIAATSERSDVRASPRSTSARTRSARSSPTSRPTARSASSTR